MHSVRMVVEAQSQSIRTDGGEDLYCLCRGRVCRAMYLATYARDGGDLCLRAAVRTAVRTLSASGRDFMFGRSSHHRTECFSLANEPTKLIVNQPRDRPNVP
jgi:hypothetical protein